LNFREKCHIAEIFLPSRYGKKGKTVHFFVSFQAFMGLIDFSNDSIERENWMEISIGAMMILTNKGVHIEKVIITRFYI